MGCDAFANENGVFEIEVRDHENAGGRPLKFQLRTIRIEGLPPGHSIAIEVTEGEER